MEPKEQIIAAAICIILSLAAAPNPFVLNLATAGYLWSVRARPGVRAVNVTMAVLSVGFGCFGAALSGFSPVIIFLSAAGAGFGGSLVARAVDRLTASE